MKKNCCNILTGFYYHKGLVLLMPLVVNVILLSLTYLSNEKAHMVIFTKSIAKYQLSNKIQNSKLDLAKPTVLHSATFSVT